MSAESTILHLTLAAECLADELQRREELCRECIDCDNRDISDTVGKAFNEAKAVMEHIAAKTRTHAGGGA